MSASIRLATVADAAAIQAIYAPIVRSTVISFEFAPPTVEEIGVRVAATLTQFPWLVGCVGETVVGYVYAGSHSARSAYQWAVNVSAYVHEDWRGRGIGRQLYEVLFRLLVAQGFYAAYAGVTLPNPASVGLHEALGFEPVGVYRAVGYKFGRWHDVGWWQRSLRPRAAEPQPPRSLAEASATPEWAAILAAGSSDMAALAVR